MKVNEKTKAIKMRRKGESIIKIANKLGVSKSTVSIWTRHIKLTFKQKRKLGQRQHLGANKRKQDAREKRIFYRKQGAEVAKRQELLHAFGCALYWGEGAKNRISCRLSNSDPFLLKKFIAFVKKYFPENKMKAHVVCYTGNGLSVKQIETYWSNILDLPKQNFYKTTVNNISKSSKKIKPKNKLLHGTLHLYISGGMKVVQHIFGAIEEYGNFSTNFHLD